MTDKPKAPPTPIGTIARALAEAELHGDREVATRYGVNRSTLRSWRGQVSEDAELAELLTAARAKLLEQWRPAVTTTLIAACAEIRRRVEAKELSPMELIGLVRTLGSMSVEAGALLGGGTPSEADRS